jgi:hypothetical protein
MPEQPTRMTGGWTETVTIVEDTNKVWTNDAKHKFKVQRPNGMIEKVGIKKDVLGWEAFTTLQAGQQVAIEVKTGIYTKSPTEQFPFANIEHWAPFTGNLPMPAEATTPPPQAQQAPAMNPNGTMAPPAPAVDMAELARTILFAGALGGGNEPADALKLADEAYKLMHPTLQSLTNDAAGKLDATPIDDEAAGDDDIPF